jgi:hypothetical protein
MEVPVIKIKENCPGKSDEKLIKSVTNMVGQAFHCMWHAALPSIELLHSMVIGIRHQVTFMHSVARQIETFYTSKIWVFLKPRFTASVLRTSSLNLSD